MSYGNQGADIRAALHATALDMAPLSTLKQYPQHASVQAACHILADLGDMAARLQTDLDEIEQKLQRMEMEEDASRDDVAIEIEEKWYFALAKVLDEFTNMIIRSNDNEGELA